MTRVDQNETLADTMRWGSKKTNVKSKISICIFRQLTREMPSNCMTESLLSSSFKKIKERFRQMLNVNDCTNAR